jgi:para-nitrobenzyl esterase
VLPDADWRERFARGEYNKVPVVLGTNRDEAKLFIIGSPDLVRRWFGIFPMLRVPEEQYELVSEYSAKAWKASGVDTLAPLLRGAQGASVFAYRFDWDEEPTLFFADYSVLLGAAHGFEIPFVFGHWRLGGAGDHVSPRRTGPDERRCRRRCAPTGRSSPTAAIGPRPQRRPAGVEGLGRHHARGPKYVVLDTETDGGVRMSYEVYDKARIVAEVREDKRLPGWREYEQLRGLALPRLLHARGLRRGAGLCAARVRRLPPGRERSEAAASSRRRAAAAPRAGRRRRRSRR